jgi:hypothetical protein
MQKRATTWLLIALVFASAGVYGGCGRAKASGKLQIMYSGNIKGNVSPCG